MVRSALRALLPPRAWSAASVSVAKHVSGPVSITPRFTCTMSATQCCSTSGAAVVARRVRNGQRCSGGGEEGADRVHGSFHRAHDGLVGARSSTSCHDDARRYQISEEADVGVERPVQRWRRLVPGGVRRTGERSLSRRGEGRCAALRALPTDPVHRTRRCRFGGSGNHQGSATALTCSPLLAQTMRVVRSGVV